MLQTTIKVNMELYINNDMFNKPYLFKLSYAGAPVSMLRVLVFPAPLMPIYIYIYI